MVRTSEFKSFNPSLLSDLNPITCQGVGLPRFDESIYGVRLGVDLWGRGDSGRLPA